MRPETVRALLALVATALLLGYCAHLCTDENHPRQVAAMRRLRAGFPTLRLLSSVIAAMLCWAWVMRVCAQHQIDFLAVFEFPRKHSVTWQEVLEHAALSSFGLAAATTIYLRGQPGAASPPAASSSPARAPPPTHHAATPSPFGVEIAVEEAEEAVAAVETAIVTHAQEYVLPAFTVCFVVSLLWPFRRSARHARNAFGRVLLRCLKLPFGRDVKFVDFFLADWGCSLVIPAMDLFYASCYYVHGYSSDGYHSNHVHGGLHHRIVLPRHTVNGRPANAHPGAAAAGDDATSADPFDAASTPCAWERYYFALAAVPYVWRACQTVRMYRRTRNRAHLCNHAKYQSFLVDFAVKQAYTLRPTSAPLYYAAWGTHTVAEVFGFLWDLTMDWGFIGHLCDAWAGVAGPRAAASTSGGGGETELVTVTPARQKPPTTAAAPPADAAEATARRGPPKRLLLFRHKVVYVLAAAFDFVGRFFYVAAELWLSRSISPPWLLLIQSYLEIARRAVWAVFRLENENVANLEAYRPMGLPSPYEAHRGLPAPATGADGGNGESPGVAPKKLSRDFPPPLCLDSDAV